MSREGQIRTHRHRSVSRRLYAVRNYLRSIHAACLQVAAPEPGHVLLIEEDDARQTGMAPGGYALVARVGDWVLLSPIQLSAQSELEYADRLVKTRYGALSLDMVVGRETMIIPE
jgi:hypothetical protein